MFLLSVPETVTVMVPSPFRDAAGTVTVYTPSSPSTTSSACVPSLADTSPLTPKGASTVKVKV